jgi:hypothetical protein
MASPAAYEDLFAEEQDSRDFIDPVEDGMELHTFLQRFKGITCPSTLAVTPRLFWVALWLSTTMTRVNHLLGWAGASEYFRYLRIEWNLGAFDFDEFFESKVFQDGAVNLWFHAEAYDSAYLVVKGVSRWEDDEHDDGPSSDTSEGYAQFGSDDDGGLCPVRTRRSFIPNSDPDSD